MSRSWRRPLPTAARFAMSVVRAHGRDPFATVPFDRAGTLAVADLRTPLGRWLYRYRVPYDDEDFGTLRELLHPGAVFVDCGANVGQFTLTAAPLVGSSGAVLAIEPAPNARAALERSVRANGFDQVVVLPFALSDASGEAAFTAMGAGDGLSSFAPADAAAGKQITVQVRRLDECVAEHPVERIALVKMDVEGAEFAALQGGTRLLDAGVPFLIEVEDEHLRRQGSSAAAIYELFADFGYVGAPTSGPSPNVLFSHPSRAR